MPIKPAKGVHGHLIATQEDRGFVLRVPRETPLDYDLPFVDYELAVEDLNVEITSEYYCLIQPGPGEAGSPRVAYRPREAAR